MKQRILSLADLPITKWLKNELLSFKSNRTCSGLVYWKRQNADGRNQGILVYREVERHTVSMD